MTRTVHKISSALVLISALALILQIRSVKADDQFLLEMKVDKSLIAVGESIVFTLTLTNVRMENITLVHGNPLFDVIYCVAGTCYRCSDGYYHTMEVDELKLAPGENRTQTLTWNLYQYKKGQRLPPEPGQYFLGGICYSAEVSTLSPAKITVTYNSDLNKDLKVDILDVFAVVMVFGSRLGDQNWNPIADLDKNDMVDMLDIFSVAADYGKTVSTRFF